MQTISKHYLTQFLFESADAIVSGRCHFRLRQEPDLRWLDLYINGFAIIDVLRREQRFRQLLARLVHHPKHQRKTTNYLRFIKRKLN